jgi:hypothetical protein
LISTKGFAFRGAIVEPPRLRLRGLHKPLSPAGVFAFRSNQQLTWHDINIIQSKYIEIQDRAEWIIKMYESVTVRNGKYSPELLQKKLDFEEFFFKI